MVEESTEHIRKKALLDAHLYGSFQKEIYNSYQYILKNRKHAIAFIKNGIICKTLPYSVNSLTAFDKTHISTKTLRFALTSIECDKHIHSETKTYMCMYSTYDHPTHKHWFNNLSYSKLKYISKVLVRIKEKDESEKCHTIFNMLINKFNLCIEENVNSKNHGIITCSYKVLGLEQINSIPHHLTQYNVRHVTLGKIKENVKFIEHKPVKSYSKAINRQNGIQSLLSGDDFYKVVYNNLIVDIVKIKPNDKN
jgi:hypothetical protein